MEKAYDLQGLLDSAKEQGMELAEDAAQKAVKAVMGWLKESAKLSENKFDDVLLPVLEIAEPAIMAELDKIDGKEG